MEPGKMVVAGVMIVLVILGISIGASVFAFRTSTVRSNQNVILRRLLIIARFLWNLLSSDFAWKIPTFTTLFYTKKMTFPSGKVNLEATFSLADSVRE